MEKPQRELGHNTKGKALVPINSLDRTPLYEAAAFEQMQQWLDGDTPRTGRNMPTASHKAADRSQLTRRGVAINVLKLVHEFGPVTGAELNEHYRALWEVRGWRRAAFDSPRKRARELAGDDLLHNIAEPGHDATYMLTVTGLDEVSE